MNEFLTAQLFEIQINACFEGSENTSESAEMHTITQYIVVAWTLLKSIKKC